MARYKAKISYLPVRDKELLRKTKLKSDAALQDFDKDHFHCDEVTNYEPNNILENVISSSDSAHKDTNLVKVDFSYILNPCKSSIGPSKPQGPLVNVC